MLAQHRALVAGLAGTRHKLNQVIAELRRALGITPMSERRPSRDPLGPISLGDGQRLRPKLEQLELRVARLERLTDWHRQLARRHKTKGKAIKKEIADLPVEEIELSPEEQAEIAQETREGMERMRLGGEPDPALRSVTETLMTAAQVETDERSVVLPALVDEKDEVIDTVVEKRERYDFSFSVTRVAVAVEKKVVIGDDGERRIISASTADLGPPRCSVTWEFLAHMAVLVVQYAMPLNRLGKLVSTPKKKFTAGALGRLLHYVAERFAPIYLELAEELADSEILVGDDTPSRVIEVNSYFTKAKPGERPPWARYCTRQAAVNSVLLTADTSLGAELAADLGFEFERRNSTGTKQALNTTTASGRSVADDPRSLIVFYRSHLGGFGNLLEMLLEKRNPASHELTIQSDLATVNLVSKAVLCSRFTIRYVGCMSHARRPFALYEAEDPDRCARILHLFKGLAIHEYGLNLHGRNRENVLAVRGIDSRELWMEIREVAQEMTKKWSASTKLGNGARYIDRHFDKLTAYLDDPRLELTNNFSERMLRTEKQIEASALFRTTLEGRFALDIMRTVLQTAVAAGVPMEKYMLSVLRSPMEKVAAAPEQFTPLAFARAAEPPPNSRLEPS